jgi:hypothetical protein
MLMNGRLPILCSFVCLASEVTHAQAAHANNVLAIPTVRHAMSNTVSRAYTIRRVREDDLNELIGPCAEHAAYERADFSSAGKIDALRRSIF